MSYTMQRGPDQQRNGSVFFDSCGIRWNDGTQWICRDRKPHLDVHIIAHTHDDTGKQISLFLRLLQCSRCLTTKIYTL